MTSIKEEITRHLLHEQQYQPSDRSVSYHDLFGDLMFNDSSQLAIDEMKKFPKLPKFFSVKDLGDRYQSNIIDRVLSENRQYGNFVYDYLRLIVDESLFISAVKVHRSKLIAICLLRVPITPRLQINFPKDLRYLLGA